MAGGLLNLVSSGQQNVILNGNPSKTFWKKAYVKYTNFGMQRFRIDFEGSTMLRLAETSTFQFKVPRYADLLMDTYVVVNLPNIWSPILPPQEITNADGTKSYSDWSAYEFKWITYIGAQMISKITITCGNQKLQEYSGSYLLNAARRDFSGTKLDLFYKMIGHVTDLYDPANSNNHQGYYPNAYFTDNAVGAQPSILGRQLYIPLNSWFTMTSDMAFPLVSLQYNELQIAITFRPINELFVVRDVFDYDNNHPYIAPNFNLYQNQMYRFLQTPPDTILGINSYLDQRSDVNLRNEWSNYTNWPYFISPIKLIPAPKIGDFKVNNTYIGPGINPNGTLTNYDITEFYKINTIKEILLQLGILLDGQYRENPLPSGVFKFIEKYTRIPGGSSSLPDELYCYNFCLDSNFAQIQPSGAINMNRFNSVQLEFTTINPPVDPFAQVLSICDPESGDIIGINKPTWRIYLYNYNLYVIEERINMIIFVGGNAALMYAT